MSLGQKEYVCGFCFMPGPDGHKKDYYVALIRKAKPLWQRGLLNGIGGKVEPGETALDAMVREFSEEAGMLIHKWTPFVSFEFPVSRVHFFFTYLEEPTTFISMTEEQVEVWNVDRLRLYGEKIPNLNWLIPMALSDAQTPAPNLIYAQ